MANKANLGLMAVVILVASTFSVSAFAGSLVAWGDNDVGQCAVPTGDDFAAVAAGGWHNLALKADGSLVVWGDDYEGMGDAPVGNDFVAIACGSFHNLSLKSDGSVVAWGENEYNQCDVPDGNNFVAIAAGGWHSLGLKSDGSVVAWGDNYDGQCDVPEGNDFIGIAGGMYHSLALKADGTIVAWGYNYSGEIDVPDGNNFVAIGGGQTLSTALKSDGFLVAWGWNAFGQCDVPAGNDFIALATCFNHSLALKSDGSLVAWGDNYWGQCNVPSGNNFIGMAAGDYHSVALVVEPTLIGLEITGPNEVAENFQARYQAIAHYDKGSSKDVTDLAAWSVEPEALASMAVGVLQTEDVDKLEEIIVRAEYGEGEVTVEAEKPVKILAICPSGSALEFDGVNDYVNCGNDESLYINDKITVAAWIYPKVNRWAGIVSKGDDAVGHDDYGLWFNNGKIEFSFNWPERWGVYPNGDRFIGNTVVPLNSWSYFAGTWDGSKVRLYVNGQLDREFSWTYGINTSGAELYIGVNPGGGNEYFKGYIDQVVIYNKALSAEEIRALMHNRADTDDPTQVGYWNFDEGEGQEARDSSIYGNDGTLGSSDVEEASDPAWIMSDAPVGVCNKVAVDIKPGSCPNPLNLASRGVLPVAVLGAQDFDVSTIHTTPIRLDGVAAIRSSIEDVATAPADPNDCGCTTAGPDGYPDLTLKFKTEDIVKKLINDPGELFQGQTLTLTLRGELTDGTAITGTDCVVLVGNVPRHLLVRVSDINGDGVVNMLDLAKLAEYWLESCEAQ